MHQRWHDKISSLRQVHFHSQGPSAMIDGLSSQNQCSTTHKCSGLRGRGAVVGWNFAHVISGYHTRLKCFTRDFYHIWRSFFAKKSFVSTQANAATSPYSSEFNERNFANIRAPTPRHVKTSLQKNHDDVINGIFRWHIIMSLPWIHQQAFPKTSWI